LIKHKAQKGKRASFKKNQQKNKNEKVDHEAANKRTIYLSWMQTRMWI